MSYRTPMIYVFAPGASTLPIAAPVFL
ncbi:MAG: hypothetical protein QOE55_8063, partial [Acidobacteriaceae bacterium]|nr:hypothetical protein [Acidobacteriaceae bacterium]